MSVRPKEPPRTVVTTLLRRIVRSESSCPPGAMAGRHAPAGVSADALPQRTLPARPAQGILATPPSARDGRESAARVEGRPRGGPPEGHVHQTGVVGLGPARSWLLGTRQARRPLSARPARPTRRGSRGCPARGRARRREGARLRMARDGGTGERLRCRVGARRSGRHRPLGAAARSGRRSSGRATRRRFATSAPRRSRLASRL